MVIEIVKENDKYFLKSNKSYKTLKALVKAMDKSKFRLKIKPLTSAKLTKEPPL